jgi:hypothetical protein
MLREEHRPRVLRKIFGPVKVEVTEDWQKLCIEELRDLCSSPHIITRIGLGG